MNKIQQSKINPRCFFVKYNNDKFTKCSVYSSFRNMDTLEFFHKHKLSCITALRLP